MNIRAVRSISISVIMLALVVSSSSALAIEGNMSFGVRLTAQSVLPSEESLKFTDSQPVTSEESKLAVLARPLPSGLITPSVAPTASIIALARALKHDPDLIYEYVRNNIEYYPIWGVQKGPAGALLDGAGTAFDQASLMVSLLRQSGYVASYIMGDITLSGGQLEDWLDIDNRDACRSAFLLAGGGVPITSASASSSVECPGGVAALYSLTIGHVWVKVIIGGTAYYFDPSYKPHTFKTGINLVNATGYDAASYLSQAKTGATIDANYVQNINRTNIRSALNGLSQNLAAHLRVTKPAAVLEDVIGGKVIIPHTGGKIRQTVLPYQASTTALTEWSDDIPHQYRPTINIKYGGIDKTFASDALYDNRLSIGFNGYLTPLLKFGSNVTVGTAGSVSAGTESNVVIAIAHPAYSSRINDHVQKYKIRANNGATYLIGSFWGDSVGRGFLDSHHRALNGVNTISPFDSDRARSYEIAQEASLSYLLASHLKQHDEQIKIHSRLANFNRLNHHRVVMAGYDKAAYIDLGGSRESWVSRNADNKTLAAAVSAGMHGSILESNVLEQATGVSGVSTTKLLDSSAALGYRIYDLHKDNYASVKASGRLSCTAADFLVLDDKIIKDSKRLVMPDRCRLTENKWAGSAYYSFFREPLAEGGWQYTVSSYIDHKFLGGYQTYEQASFDRAYESFINSSSTESLFEQHWNLAFGDPIDLVKGNYLYEHEDISTGTGEFPMKLSFRRLYSSGLHFGPNNTPRLGSGWRDNFDIRVQAGGEGLQGLGEDSALDAVNSIVEIMVSLSLLDDFNAPLDRLVIAALGHRWFGDNLLDNTVNVTQGLNTEVFVKLPDGTYNPPPGSSAKLIKNANNTYTYETVHKAKMDFDTTGKITIYTHTNGVQVKYAYSGNNLTSVTNSLGSRLVFTNTNGRITQVADGARNVKYAYYDTWDRTGSYKILTDLYTFTDATQEVTKFVYGGSSQLTKIWYPSNPAAYMTNVYDSQRRVQTQTDANGNLYSYYFAGSRSEEVGPGGVSRTVYLGGNGKVLKEIDPLGRVTTNTYDGQARLVNKTLPEGNRVEYEYDDNPCWMQKRCTHNVKTVRQVPKKFSGLLTLNTSMTYESGFNRLDTVVDARLHTSYYTYTAQGLPLAVRGALDSRGVAPETTYGYASYTPTGFSTFYLQNSETKKISSTASVINSVTYNTSNKYVPATKVVDSGVGKLNLTTTYTYDVFGNLTQENGPRTDVADTTSYSYDAERRVTQVTNALGKMTRVAYDADGRVVRSAAQIGRQWMVSCKTYTKSGKELKAWGPSQTALDTTCPTAVAPVPVTDYAYDTRDRLYRVTENLTAAEGGNRVTETVYNADDSVAEVKKAVSTALAQTYVTNTYTTNGLLATVKDANNNLTTYEYDGVDRKVKTRFPDKIAVNASSTTDYEQYGYDKNGNVTSQRLRNGQTVALVYDRLNRLVSRTYPVTTDNVNFTYDLLDRRLSATKGTDVTSYVYDNAGRVTSTTTSGKTIGYEYNAAGSRKRTVYPEASFYVDATLNTLNLPYQVEFPVAGRTYNFRTMILYDDISRRTGVYRYDDGYGIGGTLYSYTTQLAPSKLWLQFANSNNEWNFTRNQLGDITGLNWSNDAYQWSGYTNTAISYTSNGQNQQTSAAGATLTYDANGNLTGDGVWSYTYDLDNRLTSANKTGLTATLAYDPEGRLKQTVINGSTTNLLYDGTNLIAEYDGAGALLRRYIHGHGVDEPVAMSEGSALTYFFADHQGSIVATSNISASSSPSIYTYGPYGEPNVTTGSRFRYTGQQLIGPLNLYYYKARFYSPQLGRFLQTDPVGYADDMNMYAYVGNNPINFTDPTGMLSFPWHFGITYVAARDAGLGFFDSLSLAWNAMAVDGREGSQGSSSSATAQHMMSGINEFGVHDTPGVALVNGQNFINSQLNASMGGDVVALGNAIHGAQDKYSDSHGGADWDGSFSALGFFGAIGHVLSDTFPGLSNVSGAYDETRALIESSASGNSSTYLESSYNMNHINFSAGDNVRAYLK